MVVSENQTIRVFLVDDHEVVRIGLRAVLHQTPGIRIVGEASTLEDTVAAVEGLRPDVVLMDIRLASHDSGGIEAARAVLAACPGSKVLFLTSYADDRTVLAALMSGAQGYILKDIASDQLEETIKAVAAGSSILDPRLTRRTLDWLRSANQADKKSQLLSPQEERILPLLAEGKTNKEIAATLNLSDKTVKNYLANIFAKLDITSRSQAAAFYASSGPPPKPPVL